MFGRNLKVSFRNFLSTVSCSESYYDFNEKFEEEDDLNEWDKLINLKLFTYSLLKTL